MDAKAEKLAQARRKLREYQSKHQHQQPQNRCLFTQNDSNTSSSSSHEATPVISGRRSASSLQSGMTYPSANPVGASGFVHDDHKSPFERVRSVSQCSRAPPQSSESIIPLSSMCSATTVTEQHEQTERFGRNVQSGENIGHGQDYEREFDSREPQLASGGSKERLQLVQNNDGTLINDSSSNSSGMDTIAGQPQGLNGAMKVEREEQRGRVGMSLITKEEYERVVEALHRAETEKSALAGQLSELHGHYTDIYGAYTKLSESVKNGGAEGGIGLGSASNRDSALSIQLNHLKTAMSVLVKEKTTMQQQLREANEAGEQRARQIQSIQSELADKNGRLIRAEAEVNAAKQEIESLNGLVRRATEELEKCRRECAQWQAKIWHIQQDSNDAQERLKLSIRESEAAQAELQEARRRLHLKEIYLRQVGAYGAAGAVVSEQDIQSLQAENENLKSELTKKEAEKEQLKEEARVAKEHYEAYGTQLNQNVLQISAELESVSAERLSLKSKVEALEDELDVIRGEQGKRDERRNPNEKESVFETIHLRQQLSEAEEKRARMERQLIDSKNELEERDREIAQLKSSVQQLGAEMHAKLESLKAAENALEKQKRESEQKMHFNEDVRTLAEQLQNEKATVSRAVAQNHELKEQLIELQNKIVTLSEESMERESGRLSALYTIEQLQMEMERLKWHQMDEKDDEQRMDTTRTKEVGRTEEAEGRLLAESRKGDQQGFIGTRNDDGDENVARDESVEEVENASSEESEVKNELKHVKQQLEEVKDQYNQLRMAYRRVTQESDELRRIMEQNAEDENQNTIRVELGQAVARINALSLENAHLRDRIAEMEQRQFKSNNNSNSNNEDPEMAQKTVEVVDFARSNGIQSSELCNQRTSFSSKGQREDEHEEVTSKEKTERYEELGKDMVNEMNDNENMVMVENSGGGANCAHAQMPSIAEKPLAWTELEARFARAMRQNADLVEQNERLEHVILQLQCENDTIGEYVTIYQHQRKIIRERMHEKEEAVARLSLEKEQVQEKLSELQQTLVNVLTKKGILQSYDREKVRRKKRDTNGAIVRRANKLRSFSHSTVDEFSGDEETVVDGRTQVIPEVGAVTDAVTLSEKAVLGEPRNSLNSPSNGQQTARIDLETGTLNSTGRSSNEQQQLKEITNERGLTEMVRRDDIAGGNSNDNDNDDDDEEVDEDLGVQRILNLISELQNTERGRLLPPCDPKMHCRECRGKLITL